jgi:hypothetical protein
MIFNPTSTLDRICAILQMRTVNFREESFKGQNVPCKNPKLYWTDLQQKGSVPSSAHGYLQSGLASWLYTED